jgi:pimeloyl-ACP methyl ester carboxylesterase
MASIPAPERPPVQPGPSGRERQVWAVPAIDRAEVSLHGHRVNFNIAGQGPAVVLIHGVAGRAAQWDQTVQLLAENHTVVAPDLLGHGDSA